MNLALNLCRIPIEKEVGSEKVLQVDRLLLCVDASCGNCGCLQLLPHHRQHKRMGAKHASKSLKMARATLPLQCLRLDVEELEASPQNFICCVNKEDHIYGYRRAIVVEEGRQGGREAVPYEDVQYSKEGRKKQQHRAPHRRLLGSLQRRVNIPVRLHPSILSSISSV